MKDLIEMKGLINMRDLINMSDLIDMINQIGFKTIEMKETENTIDINMIDMIRIDKWIDKKDIQKSLKLDTMIGIIGIRVIDMLVKII